MSIIKGRAKKLLIDKLVVQTKSVIFKYKRLLVVAISPRKAAIQVSVRNSEVVEDRVNVRVNI